MSGLPPIAIIVMHQKGCGACAEFLPRVRRIAARYCVAVYYLDAGDEKNNSMAENLNLKFTPTTAVWRPPSWHRPEGLRKWEMSMTDEEIVQAFNLAVQFAGCER